MIVKRNYIEAEDGNPWDDNPCRDEQGHSVVWGPLDEMGERRDRCVACGLAILKGSETTAVEGYIIRGRVFNDVEEVKRHGERAARRLIEEVRPSVAKLCVKNNVEQLDMFGSMALGLGREDSDVDVLVEFVDGEYSMFDEYFNLKWGLEKIFDRDVDLVVERNIHSTYLKKSVSDTRRNIYEK